MGTAVDVYGSLVTHNSLPVFESKARKRASLVAPTNTRPPAVTMGPALLADPASCFPSGNDSTSPSGTCQAKSPVFALTAIRRPHGGRKQGRFATVRPLASFTGALKPNP